MHSRHQACSLIGNAEKLTNAANGGQITKHVNRIDSLLTVRFLLKFAFSLKWHLTPFRIDFEYLNPTFSQKKTSLRYIQRCFFVLFVEGLEYTSPLFKPCLLWPFIIKGQG
jgi:hypothetical protein